MVIATQNPVEMEGTYPLPEAQRDRFTARISLGYPPAAAEREMLDTHGVASPLDQLSPVARASDVQELVLAVRKVMVSDQVKDYIISLATRPGRHLSYASAPRRGHPAPAPRQPGLGRAGRAGLRDPGRRTAAGQAGARAPAAADRGGHRGAAPARTGSGPDRCQFPCRGDEPGRGVGGRPCEGFSASLTTRGRSFVAAAARPWCAGWPSPNPTWSASARCLSSCRWCPR